MSAAESEDSFEQCSHITSVISQDSPLLQKYITAVKWGVHRYQIGKNLSKRRKVISVIACGACEMALDRPYFCLHCSYAGCWASGHIAEHLKNNNHTFCVDAKSGAIFCAICDDISYHATLDRMYLASVVSVEEKQTRFQASNKPREPFKAWVPSEEERSALDGGVIPCQGRRGLLNLGQTCFMNAVLQCFIHNPLLRNYFLADKHNHKYCKMEECTSCEMDKLFSEVYSEDSTPYGPVTFLTTTWQKSPELSGYAQQDAHEFFCSTLNNIHSSSKGRTEISCNCIIHSTFAGSLQSDVTCERCGTVTTTVDPIFDISLELKEKSGDSTSGENTLGACLRRYTQPEKLGNKEYSCDKCRKATHDASKRLSIRKLPPVLSFQFKRFEHKTSEKSSTAARKLDSVIRFPASLNMMPYTTYTIRDSEKENIAAMGPEIMYEYDLFAVINHEGQMNNGHYTTYARSQDEWYKFDDDKITHATLGDCLKSSAYMCFYVKRHLEYEPHMTPAYVRAREAEAIREKEMEKEKEAKEAARMKEVEDALLATV